MDAIRSVQSANAIRDGLEADVYFYNGTIKRGTDLKFIELVHNEKSQPNAILVLVTSGGDAHAAYKIAKYMQNNYDHFTVLVPGMCKSAGTLIAVGAHCVAFAPYGELGPIDIQTIKIDNLAERQSGLTITESIEHLTKSAIRAHGGVFGAIMNDTDAIISFKTAAQAASELVTGLYRPIFAQIDPMEVGEKARSMRIASDYGNRLDLRAKNLKEDALKHLTQTYSSHSFVIDMQEAEGLFKSTRILSDEERDLIDSLDITARHEVQTEDQEPFFLCLSTSEDGEHDDDAPANGAAGEERNGEDPPAAVEEENLPAQNGDGEALEDGGGA